RARLLHAAISGVETSNASGCPKLSDWRGDSQPFVGFCDNMINHGFHVLCSLPHSQLAVCTGAFKHDSFDMRHLALRAEFVYFTCHELQQFVQQTSFFHFGFLAEVDQFSIDAIARSAPAVFIQKTAPVNSESDVLPQQFKQLGNDSLNQS